MQTSFTGRKSTNTAELPRQHGRGDEKTTDNMACSLVNTYVIPVVGMRRPATGTCNMSMWTRRPHLETTWNSG